VSAGPAEFKTDSGERGQDRLLSTLEHLLLLPATTLEDALDRASDTLADALGADKVDVFLHDPAIDSLVAVGTSRTPIGHKQHALGLDRLPLANGSPTTRVFQTGRSRLTGRADEDPTEVRGIVEGLGIRSMMCVPFVVDDRRRGVLSAAATAPDHFSPDDVRFLEAVSRWIGLVAQRAELSDRLRAQAEEAGRRAGADELIAVLAHDLRNHLTSIRGRLSLLERWATRAQEEAPVRLTRELTRSTDRLARLVADLLDSTRLERGLFALAPECTDLAALARETAASMETGRTRIVIAAPTREVEALVDPERVRQALENLLANALSHAPEGTTVRLDLRRERRASGAWVRLSVTDQGPGVAPELLPHLFERFTAGAGSQGLGLGLYLARRIAEAHGGTLTVQSSPGAGACFTISLPEDAEAAAPVGGRNPE
jgi:signal transduction histidine kinase